MPSFQIRQPEELINLRFASAKIVNHTPFSALPRQKIETTKISTKATFFASTRLISFCWDKSCRLYTPKLKVCDKTGTLSAFCVNRDTSGTNAKIPGLSRSFRDTNQLCYSTVPLGLLLPTHNYYINSMMFTLQLLEQFLHTAAISTKTWPPDRILATNHRDN